MTAAERLKTDPYAFYAQAMLRLRPLDPLDEDPSAADRGSAVHAILEAWVKQGDADPATLPRFTEAELLRWAGHPLMRALWAPRVRRAMDWVAEQMALWEAEGWTPLAAEAGGTLTLANGIALTGKADRVDRRGDGALAIVDYKTGVVPSHAQVAGGFALQLGLLGWLAEAGTLAGVPAGTVDALRFWKLGGGKTPGLVKDPLKHGKRGHARRRSPRRDAGGVLRAVRRDAARDDAVRRQAPPRTCARHRLRPARPRPRMARPAAAGGGMNALKPPWP